MKAWFLSSLLWALPLMARAETQLPNYLPGVEDVPTLAGRIIKGWFLGAAGVLALVMFIWGGFDWIVSRGNEEQIEVGKKKMIWATLGIVAVMLSYAFVNGFLAFVFGL